MNEQSLFYLSGGTVLSIAGAAIVFLLTALGTMLMTDRNGIKESIRQGFEEMKSFMSTLASRLSALERNCVPWEEFDKLRDDVHAIKNSQARTEASCKERHETKEHHYD